MRDAVRMPGQRLRSKCSSLPSFPQQPKNQSQHKAQQQASHDGKVEAEIVPGIVDVAGQSPKPTPADARPEQRTDDSDHQSDHDQHLAEFVHGSL